LPKSISLALAFLASTRRIRYTEAVMLSVRKYFLLLGSLAFIVSVGIGVLWWSPPWLDGIGTSASAIAQQLGLSKSSTSAHTTSALWQQRDDLAPEIRLLLEAYAVIQENYWENISDEQLSNLYFAAFTQLYGTIPQMKTKDVSGVLHMLEKNLENVPMEQREAFMAQLLDMVLINLQPFERSRLYTFQDREELSNTVNNVDPETDLLADLGVGVEASDTEVAAVISQRAEQISQEIDDPDQAAAEMAELERAKQSLATTALRERYAESGVETTIWGESRTDDIFYLKIAQFSPTTVEDLQLILQQAAQKRNGSSLGTALVLDLRQNIGGAIDGLPYFLGPFIGPNRYAYQFFSRGETSDFVTQTGWMAELESFKRVVILIDEGSKSSAEVMAATLKKYNVGVLVGTKTHGWGTVERVFPLETEFGGAPRYSLFLVHSLTLGDTGEPIEGTGVAPHISTTSPTWQRQLLEYYPDQPLVGAVVGLL
jgi:hypothetical protein